MDALGVDVVGEGLVGLLFEDVGQVAGADVAHGRHGFQRERRIQIQIDVVDDLLHQRGIVAQRVFLHVDTIFPHHVPHKGEILLLVGDGLDEQGVLGADAVDIIRVDAGLLDGFAQQRVEDDGKILAVAQRVIEPLLQMEPAGALHGQKGGGAVAPGHRLQHGVFALVALLQHGRRDALREGRLREHPQVQTEIQRHEFMVDHHLELVGGVHQRQQGAQLGADGLLRQQLHGVVVFRHGPVAFLGQVLFAPLDALFAARPGDPRPRDVGHILLIRQAEHGKMQLKHALQQHQRVVGKGIQRILSKLLPVKLRVQRLAQPVVEVVQPLEGRRDLGELDVMDGEQLLHYLNEIDLHRIGSPFATVYWYFTTKEPETQRPELCNLLRIGQTNRRRKTRRRRC